MEGERQLGYDYIELQLLGRCGAQGWQLVGVIGGTAKNWWWKGALVLALSGNQLRGVAEKVEKGADNAQVGAVNQQQGVLEEGIEWSLGCLPTDLQANGRM